MPGGAWAGAQDKQPAVGGSPHPGPMPERPAGPPGAQSMRRVQGRHVSPRRMPWTPMVTAW